MKNELKIFLASPRGFCAGVERAIEIVNKTLLKYGKPVYVRHEIVHNKQVVEDLKARGAIFVEEISEIKDLTRPVIFSAHGVPKIVTEEAKLKNLTYIDATCPLVSKVHRESEQLFKNGFDIILIGHKGHPEVVGTMGQLPKGSVKLVETSDNVLLLKAEDFSKPLAYITQTTLSVDDTSEIIKFLKSCSDSRCTFETKGHVASIKDKFFNFASSGTFFGTPWAENITGLVKSLISDISSTKIAPLVFKSSTTCLL